MKLKKEKIVFPLAVLSAISGGLMLIDCIIFSIMLSARAVVMNTTLTVFLSIFVGILYCCALFQIAIFFLISKSKVITELRKWIIALIGTTGSAMVTYLIIWTLQGINTSALASMAFLIGAAIIAGTLFWIYPNKKKDDNQE